MGQGQEKPLWGLKLWHKSRLKSTVKCCQRSGTTGGAAHQLPTQQYCSASERSSGLLVYFKTFCIVYLFRIQPLVVGNEKPHLCHIIRLSFRCFHTNFCTSFSGWHVSQTGRIGNLSLFYPNYVEGTLPTSILTNYITVMYDFASVVHLNYSFIKL